MEGLTCPEPLEHTVLDTTLDGGLVEKISDWEPVAHPVLDNYPGRSTYGGDYRPRAVRAFGSGEVPGRWTHGSGCQVWNRWSSRFLIQC